MPECVQETYFDEYKVNLSVHEFHQEALQCLGTLTWQTGTLDGSASRSWVKRHLPARVLFCYGMRYAASQLPSHRLQGGHIELGSAQSSKRQRYKGHAVLQMADKGTW